MNFASSFPIAADSSDRWSYYNDETGQCSRLMDFVSVGVLTATVIGVAVYFFRQVDAAENDRRPLSLLCSKLNQATVEMERLFERFMHSLLPFTNIDDSYEQILAKTLDTDFENLDIGNVSREDYESFMNQLALWQAESEENISDEIIFSLEKALHGTSDVLCIYDEQLSTLPEVFHLIPKHSNLVIMMPYLQELPQSLLESSVPSLVTIARCHSLREIDLTHMSGLTCLHLTDCEALEAITVPSGLECLLLSSCDNLYEIEALPQNCTGHIDNCAHFPSTTASVWHNHLVCLKMREQSDRSIICVVQLFFDYPGLTTKRMVHGFLTTIYSSSKRSVSVLRACPFEQKGKNYVIKVFESAHKASKLFNRFARLSILPQDARQHVVLPFGYLDENLQGLEKIGKSALVYEDYPLGDLTTFFLPNPVRPPLTIQQKRQIAAQLFNTLAHCHDAGFLHHDIKLENILLKHEKQKLTAAFADFDGYIDTSNLEKFIDLFLQDLIKQHCVAWGERVEEDKKRLFDEKILPQLAEKLVRSFTCTAAYVPPLLETTLLSKLSKCIATQIIKQHLCALDKPKTSNYTPQGLNLNSLVEPICEVNKIHDTASLALVIAMLLTEEDFFAKERSVQGSIIRVHGLRTPMGRTISDSIQILNTKKLAKVLQTKGLQQEQVSDFMDLLAPYEANYLKKKKVLAPSLFQIAKGFS